MAESCPGFHWIGQPITSCDRCGRPAWDHDYDMRSGGTPFGELVPVAWSRGAIATWEARDWISTERAAEMLRVSESENRG